MRRRPLDLLLYGAPRLSQADDFSSHRTAAGAVLVRADVRVVGSGGLSLAAGPRDEPEPGLLGAGAAGAVPDPGRDGVFRRYGTGRALAGGGDLLRDGVRFFLLGAPLVQRARGFLDGGAFR